jgi:hypothetical protein
LLARPAYLSVPRVNTSPCGCDAMGIGMATIGIGQFGYCLMPGTWATDLLSLALLRLAFISPLTAATYAAGNSDVCLCLLFVTTG